MAAVSVEGRCHGVQSSALSWRFWLFTIEISTGRHAVHTSLGSDWAKGAPWRPVLESTWTDWRVGLAVAAVLAAGAGLISAWLTPRGPVTTPQALASMAAALLVGVAAGLVTGSRWSMLVTPAVFVVAFELARLGSMVPRWTASTSAPPTASSPSSWDAWFLACSSWCR